MKRLKLLGRLAIPALALGMLTAYADYIEGSGQLPLGMILALTLVLGFLAPKGRWRWVILIGVGVHIANTMGHLIDSSPIPPEHQITLMRLLGGLIPALIGTYTGIFAHRSFFEGDTWAPKGTVTTSADILRDLETLTTAMAMKKKAETELIERGEAIPITDQPGKVNLRLHPSLTPAESPSPPHKRLDPEQIMTEAMAKAPRPAASPAATTVIQSGAAPKSDNTPSLGQVPPPRERMTKSPLAAVIGFSWPSSINPEEDVLEVPAQAERSATILKTPGKTPGKPPEKDMDGLDALARLESRLGIRRPLG